MALWASCFSSISCPSFLLLLWFIMHALVRMFRRCLNYCLFQMQIIKFFCRTARNLCKHKEDIHDLQLALICDVCGLKKYCKNEMNVHMRTHTNVRPFSCKMCLMTFRCRQSRLNHIRREHTGERPHHCMYCPMKFHDKPNLDNHLVVHTNERNHQCQKCLRRFKTSSHLWRHKKIYSGSRNCITDGRGIRGCRKSDKKSLSDRSV